MPNRNLVQEPSTISQKKYFLLSVLVFPWISAHALSLISTLSRISAYPQYQNIEQAPLPSPPRSLSKIVGIKGKAACCHFIDEDIWWWWWWWWWWDNRYFFNTCIPIQCLLVPANSITVLVLLLKIWSNESYISLKEKLKYRPVP